MTGIKMMGIKIKMMRIKMMGIKIKMTGIILFEERGSR